MREMSRPPVALVAGVLVLLLLVGGARFAAHCLTFEQASDQPAATGTPPPAAPSASASEQPADRSGERTWQRTAQVYGRAFTRTDDGRSAWLARMRNLVSPNLADGYVYTDLALVPRAAFDRFSGGESIAGETPSRAARLHYAGGLAVDTVISQNPTSRLWVVTSAQPARGPGPQAPGRDDEGHGADEDGVSA